MMSREEQDKAFQRAQKWQEAFEAMREALSEIVTNCPCAKFIGDPTRECLSCAAGRAALELADKVSK